MHHGSSAAMTFCPICVSKDPTTLVTDKVLFTYKQESLRLDLLFRLQWRALNPPCLFVVPSLFTVISLHVCTHALIRCYLCRCVYQMLRCFFTFPSVCSWRGESEPFSQRWNKEINESVHTVLRLLHLLPFFSSVQMTLYSPVYTLGINICAWWCDYKGKARNTDVNTPKTHGGCIWDPIAQITFREGLEHMWPHSFICLNTNAFWATLNGRLLSWNTFTC